jgi:hypothetical protein
MLSNAHTTFTSKHSFCEDMQIPSFSAPNLPEQTNCSTSLLLDLYIDYLQREVTMTSPIIHALHPATRDPSFLLTNKKKEDDKGYRAASGKFVGLRDTVDSLDTFFPENWRFSTLVKNVQNGKVDIDSFPRFKQHMAPHVRKMESAYKVYKQKMKEDQSLPEPSYNMRELQDGEQNKTEKVPKPPSGAVDRYIKLIKDFHTASPDGTIKKKFVDMQLSQTDLHDSYKALQQKGYVKYIVLDEKKMRADLSQLIDEEEDPSCQVARTAHKVIYNNILKEDQRTTRKEAKGASTEGVHGPETHVHTKKRRKTSTDTLQIASAEALLLLVSGSEDIGKDSVDLVGCHQKGDSNSQGSQPDT